MDVGLSQGHLHFVLLAWGERPGAGMDGWREGPEWGQMVMPDGEVQRLADTGQTVPTELCLWAREPALCVSVINPLQWGS